MTSATFGPSLPGQSRLLTEAGGLLSALPADVEKHLQFDHRSTPVHANRTARLCDGSIMATARVEHTTVNDQGLITHLYDDSWGLFAPARDEAR